MSAPREWASIRAGGRVEFRGEGVGTVFRRDGGWSYARYGTGRPAGRFETRAAAVAGLLRSLGLR